jgi:Tfp pilus assembly protein PilF
VARAWLAVWLAALCAFGQQKPKEAEPPEEDESAISKPAKEYTFNPLQAEKEIQVGVFYTKRGAWKSAKLRFEEATKWNPSSAEAWYRLAEASERLKDDKAAREAWAKYLELAPDGKHAAQARRKLGSKK